MNYDVISAKDLLICFAGAGIPIFILLVWSTFKYWPRKDKKDKKANGMKTNP